MSVVFVPQLPVNIEWGTLTDGQKEDIILQGVASCSYLKIGELQSKIYSIRVNKEHDAKKEFMSKMRELAQLYGFDPSNFGFGHQTEHALKGRKVEPKYQDLVTGKTWTGRGIQPKWVRDYLMQGRNLDEFKIKK